MPTSAEMALRGRIGAFATHSRYDVRQTSAPGRAAAERRFLDEVDPNRELDEAERLRRAEMARRMHMARIALASVQKRAQKRKRNADSGEEPASAAVSVGGVSRARGEQLQP